LNVEVGDALERGLDRLSRRPKQLPSTPPLATLLHFFLYVTVDLRSSVS
jgi:hypothetical protein